MRATPARFVLAVPLLLPAAPCSILDLGIRNLELYAVDRLSEPAAAPLEEHLLVREECRGASRSGMRTSAP